jgi:DnaJ-class molecular chaperone
MRDPYKTLGVKRDAGVDEIKAAWRTLAKAVHPDHNQSDPTASERFAEIGRAYETLKDPNKRSRYDQVARMAEAVNREQTIMQQRQAAQEAAERAKAARANAEKVMEELARANAQRAARAAASSAGDGSTAGAANPAANAGANTKASAGAAQQGATQQESAEDMIERIFGAQARAAAPKQETETEAEQRDEAAKPQTANQPEDESEENEPALAPGVIGSIISLQPFGILSTLVRRITGNALAQPQEKAPEIAAEATVTVDDILKGNWINVPLSDGREVRFQAEAGMSDGHVVHLRGQGLKLQGMPRGDVAITVHVATDSRFRIDGFDIHTILPVTIENAVLGWHTTIEGLNGPVDVSVPAWSGSDRIIRIPGEGLPDGKGGKGDIVIELRLMLWEKPDDKVTDLMRSMKNGLFL